MNNTNTAPARLGQVMWTRKWMQATEIAVVLAVGLVVIMAGTALGGGNRAANIATIWLANVMMLLVVYWGLKSRGQGWSHFGLVFSLGGRRAALRTVLQSIIVFVVAISAFLAGVIVMAILLGRPEQADMSQYSYLRGNLAMTLLALASIYLVSSFAEEVIYRGFLMTRLAELQPDGKAAQWIAIAVSSLIFGVIHSEWGLAGMVQATCMGIALGTAYLIVKRNLWVTILAHAYMDTILVVQMYLGAD